jgi:BirA family biotin operon repressor/biotin-[acetyl-CoA-carboxylase] ligase
LRVKARPVRSGWSPIGRAPVAAGAAGPGYRSPASAPPEHWPELSFVAALAAHDAVAEAAPDLKSRLAIKWPNDLVLTGAKFAGILIEGENSAVVVGIGINCASHPAGMEYPATDLAAAGAAVSPAALFGALSVKMIGRVAQWNGGEGFSTIRTDWLARAAGLGDDVRVRLADCELIGRFEAIDQAGSLVLRLPDGKTTTVAAGDVFMLPAPTSGKAS